MSKDKKGKIMRQQIIGWSAMVVWITISGYFIHNSPTTITLNEILLMMPQWCEMTDLTSNKGYILLSPQTTLWCCFTTLMLLSICWFFTAEEDLEEMTSDVIQVDEDNKANLVHDEITEEVLLENAKSLLEMVDLEYKHCAATIAANNETPGTKVGGETEWATGNCLSTFDILVKLILSKHKNKVIRKCLKTFFSVMYHLQYSEDDQNQSYFIFPLR